MASRYVPNPGDIVWMELDPRAGHEQGGHRPALVVSPKEYNETVGLGLFCPITSRVKGYPFEVRLPAGLKIEGVVLADQIKSLDWKARGAKRAAEVSEDVLGEVLAKIATLLER